MATITSSSFFSSEAVCLQEMPGLPSAFNMWHEYLSSKHDTLGQIPVAGNIVEIV